MGCRALGGSGSGVGFPWGSQRELMKTGKWMEGRGQWPGPVASGLEREAVSWSWAWAGKGNSGLPSPPAPSDGEGTRQSRALLHRVTGCQGRETRRFVRLHLAEGLHSVQRGHPVRAAGPLRVWGVGPVQGPLRVPERGLGGGSAHNPVAPSCALEEDRRQGAGPGGGLGRAFSVEARGQKQPDPQPRGLHPPGPGAPGGAGFQRRGALGLPRTRSGQPWGSHCHTVTVPIS